MATNMKSAANPRWSLAECKQIRDKLKSHTVVESFPGSQCQQTQDKKINKSQAATATAVEKAPCAWRMNKCCRLSYIKGTQSEMNEAEGRKRIKAVAWCFKQQFLHISLKRSNKEKHTPCTQRQGDPALALQLNFENKKHGDRHETKVLYQFLSHCQKDCGTKDQLLFGQSCQQCVDLCPKSIRSNVGRTALIFTSERNFEGRM